MNEDNQIDDDLRQALETVEVAHTLTTPLLRSIQSLLGFAAANFNSGEASVIVRAGDSEDLRFLTATGVVADKLLNVRIPAGKGIAGFVFSSGQPMAIADVEQDAQFYAEVDQQTGYSTQTILATPLRSADTVIGVLEFVNRIGAPPFAPFTSEEMDKAAFYAEAIGGLVDAHESAVLVEQFGERLLAKQNIAGANDLSNIKEWLENLHTNAMHRELLELAALVREVAAGGAARRRLAREILEALVRFTPEQNDDFGALDF